MFLDTKMNLFIYIFSRIKLAGLTTKKSKNKDNSLKEQIKKKKRLYESTKDHSLAKCWHDISKWQQVLRLYIIHHHSVSV